MLLKLEPRGERSKVMIYATPFIAIALTLLFGSGLFALMGHAPQTALYTFFIKPVSDVYGMSELLVKATPLILCATGLAIGFAADDCNRHCRWHGLGSHSGLSEDPVQCQ